MRHGGAGACGVGHEGDDHGEAGGGGRAGAGCGAWRPEPASRRPSRSRLRPSQTGAERDRSPPRNRARAGRASSPSRRPPLEPDGRPRPGAPEAEAPKAGFFARLFGRRRKVEPVVEVELEAEPEPVAVEPDPEPSRSQAEAGLAEVEPEPEPVAVEPEPEPLAPSRARCRAASPSLGPRCSMPSAPRRSSRACSTTSARRTTGRSRARSARGSLRPGHRGKGVGRAAWASSRAWRLAKRASFATRLAARRGAAAPKPAPSFLDDGRLGARTARDHCDAARLLAATILYRQRNAREVRTTAPITTAATPSS